MNLLRVGQVEKQHLTSVKWDFIICASGFESRSSSLLSKIQAGPDTRKIALAFKEHADNPVRLFNDHVFRSYNFELVPLSGNAGPIAQEIFAEIIATPGEINGLIDISSMTRSWYAAFIRAMRERQSNGVVNLYFAYAPAELPEVLPEYPPNQIVAPVPGFAGFGLTHKPTALLIGLGFDRNRAIGIKEIIDPDRTIAFYTALDGDTDIISRVRAANEDVLEFVSADDEYEFPVTDTRITYSILESVCARLSQDYQLIVTSLGPKMFGLICLIVATRLPEISVWRISAGTSNNTTDHRAADTLINFFTQWG